MGTRPSLLCAAFSVVAGHAHLLGVVALPLVRAALVFPTAHIVLVVAGDVDVVTGSFLVQRVVEFTLVRIWIRVIFVI